MSYASLQTSVTLGQVWSERGLLSPPLLRTSVISPFLAIRLCCCEHPIWSRSRMRERIELER